MRWSVVAIVSVMVVVVVSDSASARTLLAFDDPVGDARVNVPAVGVPAPWADGADIVAVSVTDASHPRHGAAINVTVQVADLDAVHTTDIGVNPDTMFGLYFDVSGTDRDGEWTARADYAPMNTVPWHFWAEGPCLDGNDADGCAGEDRDIRRDLPGDFSMEDDTVTIVFPLSLLGTITANATIVASHGFTNEVWPAYPVYAGDRAHDPTQAVAALRLHAPTDSSTNDTADSLDVPAAPAPVPAILIPLAAACALVFARWRRFHIR